MSKDDLNFGLLEGMVGMELRKAQLVATRKFMDVLEGHILPGHFTILVLIENNPGLSQSRIAEAAGLDRSSLVPVLKQFEKDGLINRISARNDRRSKIMNITSKGRNLIEKYTGEIYRLEKMLVEGLGGENYHKFLQLLTRFQELLKPGD